MLSWSGLARSARHTLLACAILGAPAAQADGFTLVTGDDYAPFTGKALPNHGLATEIVQRVFAEMGHETTVEFKPWKRGYSDTQFGKYLATFPYGKNPKRQQEFYYSEPLYVFGLYFFARADSSVTFEQDEDLAGQRVCLPLGYNPLRLQEMEEKGLITLVRPADIEACFRMLSLGRADLVRINDIIGWTTIDRLFGDRTGFRMIDRPVRESIEHLIISRQNPDAPALIAAFNAELARLKDDGTIDALIEFHVK